jgi:hypothetical protein
MHADGSLAEAPVALSEVQAYVYAARRAGASLAHALGREDRARTLHAQAETLKARFVAAFWCDDLGTYALALDGRKRPCRVRFQCRPLPACGHRRAPARTSRPSEATLGRRRRELCVSRRKRA